MKYIYLGLIVMVCLTAAIFGLQMIASETGEVVVVHTRDESGAEVTTRLWVVDHDQAQWLRVGADGSGWYSRMTATPRIRVERAGYLGAYRAVSTPAQSDAVNHLMQEKYGWRDSLLSWLVGGREGSIPIRLEPVAHL
jgi:hypothetical protein